MNKLRYFFKKVKHCFQLLFCDKYTVILTKDKDDSVRILFNCCIHCALDRVEYSHSILCEIEEDEIDQEEAIDLTNEILGNKN